MVFEGLTYTQLLHQATCDYITKCTDEPLLVDEKLSRTYYRIRNVIKAEKIDPISIIEYLEDFAAPMTPVYRIIRLSRQYQKEKKFIEEDSKKEKLQDYQEYDRKMLEG